MVFFFSQHILWTGPNWNPQYVLFFVSMRTIWTDYRIMFWHFQLKIMSFESLLHSHIEDVTFCRHFFLFCIKKYNKKFCFNCNGVCSTTSNLWNSFTEQVQKINLYLIFRILTRKMLEYILKTSNSECKNYSNYHFTFPWKSKKLGLGVLHFPSLACKREYIKIS